MFTYERRIIELQVRVRITPGNNAEFFLSRDLIERAPISFSFITFSILKNVSVSSSA